LAETFLWIHTNINDFGLSGVNSKELIDVIKFGLSNTNAHVRANAITVLGTLRVFLGPGNTEFWL